MSGQLVIAPDRRKRERAPFNTHWGTSSPDSGTGDNGDYFFHYGNVSTAIYKKVSGSWVAVGGGFAGFDSSNSEIFEQTSNFSSVTVTNFTITVSSNLRVEKDGVTVYEGKGWTRNTGTNSIDFDSTISASSDSKVIIFVGTYN
jgi:hypothetical protein